MLFNLGSEYEVVGMKGSGPHRHFRRFTASAICTLLYGYRLRTGTEREFTLAHDVQGTITRVANTGAYLVDWIPPLNHLPKFLCPWKKQADGLYDMERCLHMGNYEKGLKNPGWNFTKHMTNSTEGKNMPTEEVAYDLGLLTIAALDTSTATLLWLVVAWLTRGERFVAKAQQLLDAVVGRDRLPQFEDRPRLAYIDALINEVLRWRPIAIGGVPHATKTEDVYMGYRIPAGSTVLPHHFAIARDEATFGSNLDDYVPERWILQDGKDAGETAVPAETDTLKDMPLVAFGYGRRICPGWHLARNGLFIAAARLLWAFDVEAAVSEQTGERLAIDDMELTEGFTAEPLPFNAVFRPRGPWAADILAGCDTHQVDHGEYLDRAGERRALNMDKD